MKFHTRFINKQLFSLILGILIFSLCLEARSQELETIEVDEFDTFLLAPSFKLPEQRKIYIDEPEVEFAESWMLEFQSKTTRHYRRVIMKKYGQTLVDFLALALKKHNWDVLDAPSSDALLLKPRLVELDIYSPEQSATRQTLILTKVGAVKVDLAFLSPDGQTIMQVMDHEDTPDVIGSVFSNRSNNLIYFGMLMENWSAMAAAYLETLMQEVEKQRAKQ
ncbi:hypothetical protein [Agaribacterium sp. ZY112]|uniref:hypothetical protein n=1 Tax=Agaribacterium sp. ZY112 TaxID=3233574 RepID=UPI0035268677